MRRVSLWLCSTTMGIAFLTGFSFAQSPASGRNPAATPKTEVHATLAQLMRGILYPASNVVFAARATIPRRSNRQRIRPCRRIY